MKKRFGLSLILTSGLLALGVALSGCAGNDGSAGSAGSAGAPGANGLSALVSTTAEPAGANCAVGGQKIETGVDDNGNGVLDAAEVDSTKFVCNGLSGADATADPFLAAARVQPESCQTCHNGEPVRNGATHQDFYNDLFQQGVVKVTNVVYANQLADADGNPATAAVQSDVVTFNMTKNNLPFDCTQADALNIYFTRYDGATRQFTSPDTNADTFGDRLTIKGTRAPGTAGNTNNLGTLTYDAGTNTCTSTKAQSAGGDLSLISGSLVVYGQDESVTPIKPENVNVLQDAHVSLARFPFSALLKTGAVPPDYVSAAVVTGCQKCHTTPYFKHGYIVGDVGTGTATAGVLDFYSCKACHIDNGKGGHLSWQYMADNPQGWAGDPDAVNASVALKARYAYPTRLMNDVHMSHAMEFPYPASMANCVTCHEGKLPQTLSDANFTLATCKSCHPIDGGTDLANSTGAFAVDTRGKALKTLLPPVIHGNMNLDAVPAPACNGCHSVGGLVPAPVFSAIHPGLNPLIYDVASGAKYAGGITTTIDSATLTGNDLDVTFSAAGTVGAVSAAGVTPTFMVSFYGYETKDFLVSNHTSDANSRRMEFTLGAADNALFTTVANTPPSWRVVLHMDKFAVTPSIPAMIADGTIKRAEIAVMPAAKNAAGQTVGLNAPSKTFNLTTKAFEDNYFKGTNALVDVENGCNRCHDQLATTFHSGNRGGNIVVCRMCHVVTNGGSHLQEQSRSIDSYAHAIHSFQAFDVDTIDFNDPVEKAHYEEHVKFLFPDFATFNCEACHVPAASITDAKYNVPNQAKAMPGLLSATDDVPGVPVAPSKEVVVGPGARACGGCHRAQKINTADVAGLASFNQHAAVNGYRIEDDADKKILFSVIKNIMSVFQ